MQKSNPDYDYLMKVLLVGKCASGKTSFVQKIVSNKFNQGYNPTIGFDIAFKKLSVGDRAIKFQIWDTSGDEKFKTELELLYKGAYSIVIFFDTTRKGALKYIEQALAEVNKYSTKDSIKLLVGTKIDDETNRRISTSDIENFSKSLNIPFLEISNKDGTNSDSVLEKLGNILLDRVEKKRD